MKLLIVCGDPRSSGLGGVEEHSRNLINYLSRNSDLEVNVVTYGSENSTFVENKIKYKVLKRFTSIIYFYLFLIPLDFFRLLWAVNDIKPDLIHFQGTHPLYCLLAVFLKNKYPTVITVHGILAVELDFHHKNFLSRYLSKKIEKFSLKQLDNIIVVAPQIESLLKEMNSSRTFVISNGIDIAAIKNTPPLKSPKKPYMIFLGSLKSIKGVNILLEALVKVKSVIPDCCLLVAGSGEEERGLKDFVRDNDLESNVKFLGFVKGEIKYSYLKSSEAVILPSMWDALPISVLEGMGCGKPIIASDVGGIPHLVKDGFNGFLVRPGDVDDLAEKIITLLSGEKLRDVMGKNSELKAKDFDWSVIAEKTIQTYQKIVE